MVRAQTVPFSEIICYDDASTDNTVALAKELGLEVIAGALNRGASHSRNRLLEAASSDWVHFHDVDDRISPSFNESMIPFLQDRDRVAMCAFAWHNEQNGAVEVHRFSYLAPPVDWVKFFLERFVHLNAFVFPRLTLTTRFDEQLRICEDRDFTIRVALDGLQFNYCDEVLVEYVPHRSSTISTAAYDYRWGQEETFWRKCHSLLDSEHQPILANSMLERGRAVYWLGDHRRARFYIRLANEFGSFAHPNASRRDQLIARSLGTIRYFQLQKSWARLSSLRRKVQTNAPRP
jgi:glycosyltransferase involved in cell wall biosynthesis